MDSSSILTDSTPKIQTKKRKKTSTESKGKDTKKVKEEEKAGQEAPTGYIHVRARRGQATDSHSLAERVRREKISERMKLLQSLVPGCHQVTGKASMLDEIINYVQSLQNQVELLSMKLASMNPMPYDFGMEIESFMVHPDQTFFPSMEYDFTTIGPLQPSHNFNHQGMWGDVDEERQRIMMNNGDYIFTENNGF